MKLVDKDLAELYREMRPLGWSVVITGGGHLKWTHESGAFVFSAKTPSDWRAVDNVRQRLRRAMRAANHGAPHA